LRLGLMLARKSTMRHVVLEGRCLVLSCNRFTRAWDFPSDIPNALAADPDDVFRLPVDEGAQPPVTPSPAG
jgi:hypothetical protein